MTSWVDQDPVHVVARNGVVTLAGTLDKRSTVEIAERLTFTVPGVVSVANRLGVDYDDTAAIRSRTHESRPAGPGARPRGRPRRESLIDAEAFRPNTGIASIALRRSPWRTGGGQTPQTAGRSFITPLAEVPAWRGHAEPLRRATKATDLKWRNR